MGILTDKEIILLDEINECFHEDEGNYSEFTSDDVRSKSRAGVLASLEKKGLVYNCYDDDDLFKMWCMTPKGLEQIKKGIKLGSKGY